MLKRARILVVAFVFCVDGLVGCGKSDNQTNSSISIPMENTGGVYTVPVSINDSLTINFIVDSGATDVNIPADVVSTLVRAGTVRDEDFLGTRMYTMENGSTVPSKTFRIRSLKVGNIVIEDVIASVGDAQSTPLLGQSFLEHFKSWSLDNENHALVLFNSDGAPPPPSSPQPTASTPPPPEPTSPSSSNNGIDPCGSASTSQLSLPLPHGMPGPRHTKFSSPNTALPLWSCTTCSAPPPPNTPEAADIARAFQATFNGNNIATIDDYRLEFVGVRLLPISDTIFALISEGRASAQDIRLGNPPVHVSTGRLRITYVENEAWDSLRRSSPLSRERHCG